MIAGFVTGAFSLLTGGLGRLTGLGRFTGLGRLTGLDRFTGLLTGGLGSEIFVDGLATGTFAEDGGVLEKGALAGGILAGGGFDRVRLVSKGLDGPKDAIAIVTVVVFDTSQAVVEVMEGRSEEEEEVGCRRADRGTFNVGED